MFAIYLTEVEYQMETNLGSRIIKYTNFWAILIQTFDIIPFFIFYLW